MITVDGWPTISFWAAPAVYTSLLEVDEIKLAVMVPAPLIVAVVEAAVGLLI